MKNIWWRTVGDGNYHLLLLHGWGLNAQIWNIVAIKLAQYFTLHLVDLPGFGYSADFDVMTLDEMAEYVLQQAPDKAIWLGWSFGGLVASKVALMYPKRVQALITVASSPCFSALGTWPGINSDILTEFQYYLSKDLQRTIERFLILQTIKTETAKKDAQKLKDIAFSSPVLKRNVLNNTLEILKTIDLRQSLNKLVQPHLRIYGALDKLVPYKIISLLDSSWPNSESLVMTKAAHALFISHPDEFCKLVINFSDKVLG